MFSAPVVFKIKYLPVYCFLTASKTNSCVIKKSRVKCSCRLSNRLSFLAKRQAKKRDSFDTIPSKLISSYGGYIRDEYEAYVTTKDCKLQDLLTVYPQIQIPIFYEPK